MTDIVLVELVGVVLFQNGNSLCCVVIREGKFPPGLLLSLALVVGCLLHHGYADLWHKRLVLKLPNLHILVLAIGGDNFYNVIILPFIKSYSTALIAWVILKIFRGEKRTVIFCSFFLVRCTMQ